VAPAAAAAASAVAPAAAQATPAAAASAPLAAASAPSPACAAPGPDRAANLQCALAFARQSDAERAANHEAASLALLARADQFAPDDVRFATTRAGIELKARNQLSPAGIEAAAQAAPGDVGLAMMHAELSLVQKKFAAAVADADRVIAARPNAVGGYQVRATAHVAANAFEAARPDVARGLELDPKSADLLRLRAILRNGDGEHAGALADYRLASRLQPKPDDPFLIGATQFQLRQFRDSADTLARRPPPNAEGTYWTLWRYLALARALGPLQASGSLGPASPAGATPAWPGPVIDYYLGHLDGAALLAAAKAAQARDDQSQVCEAHFYMGEDALLRRRGDAAALLNLALKECPRNFHEHEGAQTELRTIAASTASPAPSAAP
jgi:lipoprotein NlpI